MAKLKTDSTLSRRIVRSFLDFLDSVEPAAGVDLEGIEVARECLEQAFEVKSASVDDGAKSVDDGAKSDDLINIFSLLEKSEHGNVNSDLSQRTPSIDVPSSSSSSVDNGNSSSSVASKSLQGETCTGKHQSVEILKDELFGKFLKALEKIHFLKTTPDGNDYPALLDRATRLFHDALNDMEGSGCQTFDRKNLADTLKTQGNTAMQSKIFCKAIELYSIAIALCENNAIYHCNRAAAFTQVRKYNRAIQDCLKSIEVDPNYSKAYSRLGTAYFAQGNYRDAIEKGFKKALQLDPNNESVKENIRAATQKLREEHHCRGHHQHSRPCHHHHHHHHGSNSQSAGGGPRSNGAPPSSSFTMPVNVSGIPPDMASMFTNMAGNQGQPATQNRREEGTNNVNGPGESGVRMEGGNININLGEQMPEDLTGTLRSVMQMFSGASNTQGNPQDAGNGNGAAN